MEHYNGIIFHKSGPAMKQDTNQSIYQSIIINITIIIRWEDNIWMNFEEIGVSAGNWVDSAEDRDYWRAPVNAALILRIS